MIICIVAGGPEKFLPELQSFNRAEVKWVGVDRGVSVLLLHGIVPDAAFGDFDSVSEAELSKIRAAIDDVHLYPSEKDEPDLELAFRFAIDQRPKEIIIFGATGGRLDHFFGNTHLLLKEEFLPMYEDIEVSMVDRQNIISVKLPGQHKLAVLEDKKYISFFPASAAVLGLTLLNFKYPLVDETIKTGSTLCISNELISETGTFSFYEGILLVIRSSD